MARSGLTTGACATAAVAAAAQLLRDGVAPSEVVCALPGGEMYRMDVEECGLTYVNGSDAGAFACVRKPDNDDPDVTRGALLRVDLEILPSGTGVVFAAGPGVGTITRPGLSFAVGEAAINPVPRRTMTHTLQKLGFADARITVSVAQGAEIALQTFNGRLGIVGGISILGTTGIVRPYCRKAMRDAIVAHLQMVRASSDHAVLVPGNIGTKGLQAIEGMAAFDSVEVGNEWEAGLRACAQLDFARVTIAGHPGKLAKLANGEFYTHSHHSQSALPLLYGLLDSVGIAADQCQATAEGLFASLTDTHSRQLTKLLRSSIAQGILPLWNQGDALRYTPELQIHFVRMNGELLP